MSWNDYVKNLLANGVCQSAYILGIQGQIWACSHKIQVMPYYEIQIKNQEDKVQKIVIDQKVNILQGLFFLSGLNNKGKVTHHAGIRIYNQKYYSITFDEDQNIWYLKKDKGGACIIKCNKCIIIGTWSQNHKMSNNQPQNAAQCNRVVETIGQKLKQAGF